MPREWSIPQPARLAILVALLLAVTGWQLWSLNRSGEQWAAQWLSVRNTDSLSREPAVAPSLRENEPMLSRLRQQLGVTRARRAYHAQLAIFFLSRHNSTLTLLLASGLVAAAMRSWSRRTGGIR
jgi:hypothetical protein